MLGILADMEKFDTIKGIAAPMLASDGNQFSMMINIDTDMIIPKQFLKTIKRTGLGKSLFHEMRYDYEGNEVENFILNKNTTGSILDKIARKDLRQIKKLFLS